MQSLAVMQGIDLALSEDREKGVRTLMGAGESTGPASAPRGGFSDKPYWEN